MEKIMGLTLDVEGARNYLEKNKLWWFECEPFTIKEFDEMVDRGELVITEKKMINEPCDNGVAKDYREPCVKKYEDGMRTIATYTGEHAQSWANARNICEIGMIKMEKGSVCPTLEELRENCDYLGRWITKVTKEVERIKVDNYYGYHAQYLHDMDKYLGKLQNLLGDLCYELHWKLLQIEGKDENVDSYIQSIRDYD